MVSRLITLTNRLDSGALAQKIAPRASRELSPILQAGRARVLEHLIREAQGYARERRGVTLTGAQA